MKGKWTPHIIAASAFVVFIVLGLACASSAKSADVDVSETVNVPGVSAADLYMKVNLWCSDTFKGPPEPSLTVTFDVPWERSRIISSDKNKGVIQASYTFFTDMKDQYGVYQVFIVYSSVEIQVRDGQYRLFFSNARTAAATYDKGDKKWIYAKPVPLLTNHVAVTHKVWNDLASALRDTVGGTVVGK
jgi:hypothetical protein